MNSFFIYNLKDPEDDQDATTKFYVDTKVYSTREEYRNIA